MVLNISKVQYYADASTLLFLNGTIGRRTIDQPKPLKYIVDSYPMGMYGWLNATALDLFFSFCWKAYPVVIYAKIEFSIMLVTRDDNQSRVVDFGKSMYNTIFDDWLQK